MPQGEFEDPDSETVRGWDEGEGEGEGERKGEGKGKDTPAATFDPWSRDIIPPLPEPVEVETKLGLGSQTVINRAKARFPGVFSPAEAPKGTQAPPSSFDAPGSALPPLAGLLPAKREKAVADPSKGWKHYTVAELVSFRDQINQTLPPTELSKLNLEEEVLLQFHVLREMQSDVLADEDIPANQKAQVANAVAGILKTLGDQQVTLYSSERFKDIENLMVRSLTLLPEDVAAKFIDEYEKILRKVAEK